MFSNLEYGIIIAAIIWGIVKVVTHFFPSYWDRLQKQEWKLSSELHERINKLEAELFINKEQK